MNFIEMLGVQKKVIDLGEKFAEKSDKELIEMICVSEEKIVEFNEFYIFQKRIESADYRPNGMIERVELFKYLNSKRVYDGQLPATLFQYMPLNDNTRRSFRENYLWFSGYKDFNDPFEGIEPIDYDNLTDDEVWLFMTTSFASQGAVLGVSLENLKTDKGLKSKYIEAIRDSTRKVISATKVTCMSSNEKNILMWSHYANSHKGVCIEFDILKDPLLFDTIVKVIYQKEYPTGFNINDIQSQKEKATEYFNAVARTKAEDWGYEKEWRVIKHSPDNKQAINNKASVKSILFGVESTDDDINNFIEILKSGGYPEDIEIKKAYKVKNEFAIDFKSLGNIGEDVIY